MQQKRTGGHPLFGLALKAVENGRVPDFLVRPAIRRLLRRRLNELEGSPGELAARETAFREACCASPVALVPELANEQHYEVPPEYFSLVLGGRLKYSSCEWPEGVTCLDAAENAALTTTCERAGLADGQAILELGCGWGSLTLWMAEHYPNSTITAVSNSNGQREWIEGQARECGFDNVKVVTADMNDFSTEGQFDRVVSVEMFEHMRNHEELLRRISTWLKPAGRLFVHIFCHKTSSYLFEARDERDWMAKHFFSGGMMPSANLLPSYQLDLKLVNQWQWNGQHYEKTCNAWLAKQDAAKDEVLRLFSDANGAETAVMWMNRWRMFHMACAELFGFNGGREWFVAHYLFEAE